MPETGNTALIVLAHPEPKSFNSQMKDVAADTLAGQGYAVEVSDLYAQRFDPLEGPEHYRVRHDPDWFRPQSEQRHAGEAAALPDDVAAEIDKLNRADLVVLQYPMWWYGTPAMLKGWFDRVFMYGEVYTGRMRYDAGYFKGKRAVMSVTAGAPRATFAHNGRNGDIDLLMWPTQFTLSYVGFSVLPPFVTYGVEGGLIYSDEDEMLERLETAKRNYAGFLRDVATDSGVAPLRFNGWDDWDDDGRLKPGVEGCSAFMRAEP